MTLRSYNYAPVLPVKVSRPYFSTRPQGAREKFGVWGRDYRGPGIFYHVSDACSCVIDSLRSRALWDLVLAVYSNNKRREGLSKA